jgi:acetyl esterase/lipase
MSHASSPKYAPFTVLSTSYKSVNDHPIQVYTLIPKLLLANITPASSSAAAGGSKPTPSPMIVKFHGGFLVTGDALYDDWFPQWLVDYALQHTAVVVLPNHRLLPEATGREIMDDVHDFWTWLRDKFPAYLGAEAAGLEVDLAKVLVAGESAGGYLSIQSALGSSGGLARASIATYPVLDVGSRFYTEEYEKVVLGRPTVPKDVFASHVAAVEEDAKNGKKRVVTSATPPDRLPFALSVVQQGLYRKLLGEEKFLYPLERVDDVGGQDVPPILIIHGSEDSAVPVEGSEKWVEKAGTKFGDEKVALIVQPGEHGFDTDPSVTLETPWLKDGLVRITEAWLGGK